MKYLNNRIFCAVFFTDAALMIASLLLSNMPDLAGFIFLALFGVFGLICCTMLGIVAFQMCIEIPKEEDELEKQEKDKKVMRDDDGHVLSF